jgi:RimJ/RimL family protein N-acetyltransferase
MMPSADHDPPHILTAGTMIETARLVIRGLTFEDLDQIAEVFADPQVMWTAPGVMTREQARSWLAGALQHYRDDGLGECAVVLRSTGRIIGDCGLVMRDIDGERLPEFNWDLHSGMWRNGYATEAARAVLARAAGLGLRRFCALIREQNERSQRVAARLGMGFLRHVRWEGSEWDLWVVELPDDYCPGSADHGDA